jgi:glutathione peroxidase
MPDPQPLSPAPVPQSVFDYSATLLDGRTLALGEFRGRVLLIVNTASQCGFTPQYAGLEALYRRFRERGFAVLGFPSNQFGRQEPGTAEEIGAFCLRNYGISFPLFAKVDVNGFRAHPLYRFLKREKSGLFGFVSGGRISWNFTKFLVRRSGRVAARFSPATAPESLAGRVEELLLEPGPEAGIERRYQPGGIS